MASSSADCVLGVARLISSASTRCAKIGPGEKRSALMPLSLSMIMLPTMSAGIRSGVNWMREYFRCITLRKRPQQRGLAQAGNAFEQHVSAGQQTDEHAVDDVLLSHDDLSNFRADAGELRSGELEGGVWLHPDYIISARPKALELTCPRRRGRSYR